ncbi:hypothetical protein JCM19233_4230 [Vibrio astriarenae]|nr:hypothetical protein JCM19233_4230 [Vibrio sp. C7]
MVETGRAVEYQLTVSPKLGDTFHVQIDLPYYWYDSGETRLRYVASGQHEGQWKVLSLSDTVKVSNNENANNVIVGVS